MTEVLGDDHEVFVGCELTKLHEAHYQGSLRTVFDQLAQKSEGSRLKGEVTLVMAPGPDMDAEV